MPIYIAIFCVLPLLAGLIPEYLVCRFTRRKWWKVLPPLAVAAITALVTAGRLSVWESDVSPVTQLLFVPGVPAAFALLGTLLGWRLWKRLAIAKVSGISIRLRFPIRQQQAPKSSSSTRRLSMKSWATIAMMPISALCADQMCLSR